MSSPSRPSPQPAPPHLLIAEVPQGRAGVSEGDVTGEPSGEHDEGASASEADAGDPGQAEVGAKGAATKVKKASPRTARARTATRSKAASKAKKVPAAEGASRGSPAAKAAPAPGRAKVSLVPPLPAETPKAAPKRGAPAKGKAGEEVAGIPGPEVRVRRLHRRDLNRTWEFLKMVFRGVNRETVEYQRPRSKMRFFEVYEEDGEQLLFEIGDQIVGYAECAFDASGADNWINPRYFDKRGMRPLYVDELAVHPDYQGRGVGAFMLDQVQHLARVRGCTHLVLEVAENNKSALSWYHKRNFFRLDAAIFLAQKVPAEPELLPPRRLPPKRPTQGKIAKTASKGSPARKTARSASAASRARKR